MCATTVPIVSTLDHLVWATPSIGDAARLLLDTHGLVALAGGEHPAWGTRNAVVPLRDCYLELVEVADADAPDVGFTRRIREVAGGGGGPALWCARVEGIDPAAAALGYHVVAGRRENPDGSVLSWRVAGMPQACADPALPFLIEWDDPSAMPGLLDVKHPCGAISAARVLVDRHGLHGLVIGTASGEVVLGSGSY